ncbi:MAG: ATP-binding protein [Anaerovoracaceae bacterium]|jgi:signal transduction histidine kinase
MYKTRWNGCRYDTLINRMGQGFVVFDIVYDKNKNPIDLHIVELNAVAIKMFGFNYTGKRFQQIYPNDEEHLHKIISIIPQKEKNLSDEVYIASKEKWYNFNTFKISNGDECNRYGSIITDITEQKHLEEAISEGRKRQTLLLGISDVLRPMSNTDEILSTVNHITMGYFKSDRCYYCEIEDNDIILRQDAMRGDLQSLAGVYPIESLPIHKSLIDMETPFIFNDVYTDENVNDKLREMYIQTKNISFLGIPARINGKTVGILCVVQSVPRNWTSQEVELAVEISERIWAAVERAKAEEALRKSNEALEKTIEIKDEFLSLISHELRTPLAVIVSAIQMLDTLSQTESSEKVRTYLNTIRKNSNRQLKLINNILDITKVNAGRHNVNLINLDIVSLTEEVIESIKPYGERKEIKILSSFTPAQMLMAIDREKYERVLLNLLSNAVKFTPNGGLVTIKLRQEEVGKKAMVSIKVSDNGVGIPADKQQHIFERFGQADSVLSRQAEGSGIGLHLTRMFVEMMGGNISIESKLGAGSTFTVKLPVKKVEDNNHSDTVIDEIADDRITKLAEIEFSDVYFDKKG